MDNELHPDLKLLLDFYTQQRSTPPEAFAHSQALMSPPTFFSVEKFQQHLNNPLLTPDWIAVISKGQFVPLEPTHMYKEVQNKQLFFMDKELVDQQVSRGAAVLLEGLDVLDPSINAFAARLDAVLPCALANIVAFFSQRGNEAYRGHSDVDDVLVAQIDGEKRWHLFQRLSRSANRGGLTKAQMGRQIAEVVMRPGDALYLRAGVPHICETTGQCSLHVSFDLRDKMPNFKQIAVEANNRFANDQAEEYAQPSAVIQKYVDLLKSEKFQADVNLAIKQLRHDTQAFRRSIGRTSVVHALDRFSKRA